MNRCLFPVIIRDFGYANFVLTAFHIPAGFRVGKKSIVSPQFIDIGNVCRPGCPEKKMNIHPLMFINIVQPDNFVQRLVVKVGGRVCRECRYIQHQQCQETHGSRFIYIL